MRVKSLTVIVALVAVLLFAFAGMGTGMCAGEEAGPIGYWKFDEGAGTVARDSSGQKNDGAIMNLGKYAQWVEGRTGKALEFTANGVRESGWVLMQGMGKKYDLSRGFTVQAWVRCTNNENAEYRWYIVVDNYSGVDGAGSVGFRLQLYNGSRLLGDIRDLAGAQIPPDAGLAKDVWYHVALVHDAADSSLKVYVDGAEKVAVAAEKPGRGKFGEDIRIGSSKGGYASGFNGTIDEVKIFDYARSALDISNDALR